jgi:DNA-binding transcriptional MerR regulator
MNQKYLTTQELADRFRTSPETIRYWRHTGRGPKSFKPGRLVLYAVEDVETWEAAERAAAGAKAS